ncbi:yippee-like protein [Catenaria anguillulae PL171]|uniref:Protein yippee-like n=1 Tax=Catenaria anguillulae PL171 TaxID=765915 RepID=A0A1Y2HGX4_9FUNG|nr:yippee-like protein [Catenaria anguillulae PL171]
MGQLHKRYLNASGHNNKIFGCGGCHTHLSTYNDIISKQFQGQTGRAYLFSKVVNISEGPCEERSMTTGLHVVRDVFCLTCGRTLGWTYVHAYEESQRYKEGKYILEKLLLTDIPDEED